MLYTERLIEQLYKNRFWEFIIKRIFIFLCIYVGLSKELLELIEFRVMTDISSLLILKLAYVILVSFIFGLIEFKYLKSYFLNSIKKALPFKVVLYVLEMIILISFNIKIFPVQNNNDLRTYFLTFIFISTILVIRNKFEKSYTSR